MSCKEMKLVRQEYGSYTENMVKTKSGFTIVELLIVIVVIAILAAVSVVAYNGIQTRADNAKTVTAVSAWAKALQMYNAELGSWPTNNSCLGSLTTYSSAYNGRCWPPSTSGWIVSSAFLNQVKPYIGEPYPEPSTKPLYHSVTPTDEFRGAIYYRVADNDIRIYTHFQGVSTCPSISGLGDAFSGDNNRTNGRSCYYYLQKP